MPPASSPGSLFGSPQEERVQDADSVRRQWEAHQQPSCTLDECFRFYTKEEQVSSEGPALSPPTSPPPPGAGEGGWP